MGNIVTANILVQQVAFLRYAALPKGHSFLTPETTALASLLSKILNRIWWEI
jgi:hypothetical protein